MVPFSVMVCQTASFFMTYFLPSTASMVWPLRMRTRLPVASM